jgi:hypothetical protein
VGELEELADDAGTLVAGLVEKEKHLLAEIDRGVVDIDISENIGKTVDVETTSKLLHRLLIRVVEEGGVPTTVPGDPLGKETQDVILGELLLEKLLHDRERHEELAKVTTRGAESGALVTAINTSEAVMSGISFLAEVLGRLANDSLEDLTIKGLVRIERLLANTNSRRLPASSERRNLGQRSSKLSGKNVRGDLNISVREIFVHGIRMKVGNFALQALHKTSLHLQGVSCRL